MSETEPLYFKNFRTYLDQKFEIDLPNHFKDLRVYVDRKIELEINSLALMIRDNFATKDDLERFATKEDLERFATKEDLNDLREETRESTQKILAHIGLYEIRAQNIEQILIQDHKPRIIELEKKVFV